MGDNLGSGTDTGHDQNDDFTNWERSILNTASKSGVDSSPMVVRLLAQGVQPEGIRQDSIVGKTKDFNQGTSFDGVQ